MFCGGLDGRVQSAVNTLIENNRVHSHRGDYPEEPGHEKYDEPAELHAGLISIRGSDVVIRGNWFYDIDDQTVGIQTYLGDCGIPNYEIENIEISNNVFYANQTKFLQTTASPVGVITIKNNTVIDAYYAVSFAKSADVYDGSGSSMYNNYSNANSGGLTNFNYESYLAPTAKWSVTHNLVNLLSYPSSRDEHHPSNIQIEKEIRAGNLPVTFNSLDYFKNANFNGPDGTIKFCKPLGNDDCDLTPKSDSVLCTAGKDGGHIGAIPCD